MGAAMKEARPEEEMKMHIRALRWFALRWSGKTIEKIRFDYSVWYFMTRSHGKAYCKAVFS